LGTMQAPQADYTELKKKIKEHYDELSPFYHDLWGAHIHHGYWITGKETKEEAQEILIEQLIEAAHLSKNCKVLDVGCGVGGTSMLLAERYNAEVVGITLSQTQVDMATQLAAEKQLQHRVSFLCMDAELLDFPPQSFDVVWISECLSHIPNKLLFFQNAYKVLKPGGTLALMGWVKKSGLTEKEEQRYIHPIEEGMLLPPLSTMEDYKTNMEAIGFSVSHYRDISPHVSKTWDLCLDIIKSPALWKMMLLKGGEVLKFGRSFFAMRDGFASKNFVYCMIVAEKSQIKSKL